VAGGLTFRKATFTKPRFMNVAFLNPGGHEPRPGADPTRMGGNTTVPRLQVDAIEVIG